MGVNDEEQNIEEDITVTEVDVSLRWDFNYESAMNRRSEFLVLHLPLHPLCVSPLSLSLSVYWFVSLFFSQVYLDTGLRPPLDIYMYSGKPLSYTTQR